MPAADIEEQEKGATPLFLAVRSGHAEAAELLRHRLARSVSSLFPSRRQP
jgi:ankyrin repeat protein